MPGDVEQTIVEAATLVVFRQRSTSPSAPEILFVRRARELAFAGSATVFPGGKIHQSDRALVPAGEPDADDAVGRIAAIRETLEETGLMLGIREKPEAGEAASARAMVLAKEDLGPVLERFGWTLDLSHLVPFSRWLPLHKTGRIFDTRFYLADIGTGDIALSSDRGENTHLFWASAAEALGMFERGDIKIMFPTRCNLQRLATFTSFAQAEEHARATPVVTISPRSEMRDGVEYLHIPDNAGYPITCAPRERL